MTETQVADYLKEHGHHGWDSEREEWSRIQYMEIKSLDGLCSDVDIDALEETQGVDKWMQIENQASQGSCAGHARTTCVEKAFMLQTGAPIQLNRQYAYITAQEEDGIRGDSGSTISGNAKCAERDGTCREELWPYTGRYTRIPQDLRPTLDADAKNYRIRGWKTLKSYMEVLAWCANGIGGVDIGITWNGYCKPDAEGRIRTYRQSMGGGHSVSLLDWNKRFMVDGKPAIGLWNSWGLSWGLRGIAWVDWGVIEDWCQRQTVVGFTDMINIKPRRFGWRTTPSMM